METADLRGCFAGRLLTEAAEMAPFLTDWRGRWQGAAIAVAQPDTVDDVAALVAWCRRHRVPIVPQGGNTGLSGGSVPDGTGRALLLSLTRLNRIRAIDPDNDTITVEAGCVLQKVQQAAQEVGRLLPLRLAAEGSCTIGGNLATNAGGVHALRHGVARDLCLGLEVVTASGEIWNGLRTLRKDNTGYDLRDLFIGSEGTLGIITAAVLKLSPRPAAHGVCFAAIASPAAAVALLRQAQRRLGADLTAFELISDVCLDLVLAHQPQMRRPLAARSGFYVLIEVSGGSADAVLRENLLALGEDALAQNLVTDAVVANSAAQAASLWALREGISDAQAAAGPTIKHDVSLPISAIPAFLEKTISSIDRDFPAVRLVVFGHLGDGNLHTNISPPADRDVAGDGGWSASLEPHLNRLVHDVVTGLGGSISAEHGLGVLRRDEAARIRPVVETMMMRRIKAALDPDGLMNPGKVLP